MTSDWWTMTEVGQPEMPVVAWLAASFKVLMRSILLLASHRLRPHPAFLPSSLPLYLPGLFTNNLKKKNQYIVIFNSVSISLSCFIKYEIIKKFLKLASFTRLYDGICMHG